MAVKKAVEAVSLPAIKKQRMEITLKGVTPYLANRFPPSARDEIEKKQQHGARQPRGARQPDIEREESVHLTRDGQPGLLASSVKKALVAAAPDVEMEKTFVRRALHVVGDVLPLAFKEKLPVVHDARLQGRTAHPVYRFAFVDWSCRVTILFNGATISSAQIANLVNSAGFGVGVGAWRPEKSGSHGMFEVA